MLGFTKTFVPDILGSEKLVDFKDVLACTKAKCEYWPKERTENPVEVGQRVLV